MDLAKIGVPVFFTWLITSHRAKRAAETTVEQKTTEQLVAKAVGELSEKLTGRLTRVEYVVWGVDEQNGLRSDFHRMSRQRDEDHAVLLHLSLLMRELYRRVTHEEPPPSPFPTPEILP